MVEISEDIPFLWRLSAHDEKGFCMVSMVVPFNSGDESLEHTIETDVLSFSSDSFQSEEEEMLEWNEDDISLFLKLITNKKAQKSLKKGESIKVDLSDPDIIEIIQIVAAAGFGLALPADSLLVQSSNIQLEFTCEVGAQVSLNTIGGYKACVVVEIDDDEAVCVILEKVEPDAIDFLEEICLHDLLLVKKHQLLHPAYTSNVPTQSDILH